MAPGPQLMPTNACKRAFQALARGDTGAAEALFRENLEEKSREGAKANREAAEAARNIAAFKRLTNVAEAADLYSRAAELDPENYQTWIDLGDMTLRAGHLARARSAFERSLAIAERLAQADPGNAGRQRDLSVSHNRIGDVQQVQGDLAAALTSYQASHVIFERLAQADPGNAGWQRDLSVSYNRIGDVQQAQGDPAVALTSYQASLAIRGGLAQADPTNTGWQRDLSVSHDWMGDVQRAQGDLAAALTSYQASLAIAERLAQVDPGNAGWQRDLSISHERIGDVAAGAGRPSGGADQLPGLARNQRASGAGGSWQRWLAARPCGEFRAHGYGRIAAGHARRRAQGVPERSGYYCVSRETVTRQCNTA